MDSLPPQLRLQIGAHLVEAGRLALHELSEFCTRCAITPMAPDGSTRRFFRVAYRGRGLCVGVLPQEKTAEALAEARAAAKIGRHLHRRGVPVPEVLGAEPESGLVLFEDCGERKLYDLVQHQIADGGYLRPAVDLYPTVVEMLAHMQVAGLQGFDRRWCHDGEKYDFQLMIEKESHYFLREFWYNFIGGRDVPGVEEEFIDIAGKAGTGELLLFCHRDFQSRNIMVADATGEAGPAIRFIDFQGGRLGPPGYDLASLLIDPYAGLAEPFQEELLSSYLARLSTMIEFDADSFGRQYPYLKLQRTMQILGAFSFLYRRRNKIFFKEFILPSLHCLERILATEQMHTYRHLRAITAEALQRSREML